MSSDATEHPPVAVDPIAALRGASIRSRLGTLVGDSALYGSVTALTRALALITVPILTRTLSLEQFGALDALQVALGATIAAATLGQDSALARLFYGTDDRDERRRMTWAAFVLQVGAALLGAGALAAIGTGRLLPVPDLSSGGTVLFLLVALVPVTIAFQFYRNLLKWVFARRAFVIVTFGGAVLVVALTVALVAVLGLGIPGALMATLFGLSATTFIGAWFARGLMHHGDFAKHARELLRIGLPYMAMAVSAMLIPAIDRWVILQQFSLASLGVYALGVRVAMLLQLPIMAFQTAWGPFAFAIYRERDAAATYGRVLMLYAGSAAIAAYALVAVTEPILVLVGSPAYLSARVAVVPLTFGLLIESLGWITGLGIDLSKRTYLAAISYAMGVIATAIMAWLLAPVAGLAGVATGVLGGRVVQTVLYTAFGQRAFPMRLPWGMAAVVVGVSLSLSLLVQVVHLTSLGANIGLRVMAGAGLTLFVWRVAVLPEERTALLRRIGWS